MQNVMQKMLKKIQVEFQLSVNETETKDSEIKENESPINICNDSKIEIEWSYRASEDTKSDDSLSKQYVLCKDFANKNWKDCIILNKDIESNKTVRIRARIIYENKKEEQTFSSNWCEIEVLGELRFFVSHGDRKMQFRVVSDLDKVKDAIRLRLLPNNKNNFNIIDANKKVVDNTSLSTIESQTVTLEML